MLKRPKRFGLNLYISLGEDEYAHQDVLRFDEWLELAQQTAASGKRCVRKLRRIVEICERLTEQRIDVEALLEDMVA